MFLLRICAAIPSLALFLLALSTAGAAVDSTVDSATVCGGDNSLPGYMLVTGGIADPASVPDPERAAQYGPAVWELVERSRAFYLVRATPDTVYEGDWPEWKAVVISKWPCREAGLGFWNSDAYQNEVKPLRKDAGVYDVGMFDGRTPSPPGDRGDLVPEACASPYLVVIISKVTDAAAYGAYGKALLETQLARRAGINLLFGGAPKEVLEGTWPENATSIVATYPCRAAWEAFFYGEEYVNDVRPLRENAGEFLILGINPERVE